MYCYKCGKEITENAKFCTFCGTKVQEHSVASRKQKSESEELTIASSGKRLANYFLDMGFIFIISVIAIVLFEIDTEDDTVYSLIWILFYFLYYFVMELFWQKTLAKFVTRTKVVNKSGEKPTFGQVLGRSLCRLISIEAFTFLKTQPIGWHDSMSRTRVIEE